LLDPGVGFSVAGLLVEPGAVGFFFEQGDVISDN